MARGSEEPPHKMAKLNPPQPTNVIIQFQSDAGETVGVFHDDLPLLQPRICACMCLFFKALGAAHCPVVRLA